MSFPEQDDQQNSFDAERTQPRQLEWRPPEHRPDRSKSDLQATQQAKPMRQGFYDRRYRRPPTEGAPTWLVFLGVGLLMAVIIALGAAFILSRKSREPAAEPTAVLTLVPTHTAAITNTPLTTPTSGAPTGAPTDAPSEDATSGPATSAPPPGDITVGGYVKVVAPAGLSFRQSPETTGALIEVLNNGAVLEVIDGPQQGGEYIWWQLRKPDGTEGWSAAGAGEDVFLEPSAAP